MEGKLNSAIEFAKETLMLAQDTGDAFIKGMAYSIYGGVCYQKGLFDDAKTHLLEWVSSYEKVTPVSWIGMAYGYLGLIHVDLSEYDEAVKCYKKVIGITEAVRFMPSVIKYFQSCLMRTNVLRHGQDVELSELFGCYENYKITWCKGETARNIGHVLIPD